MTLATGATTDGNGGWASVRFNGKSNQQNYLNYDGVDGTYVWDASPGYLNATGSQFRLQTSMESIAEFRVNSGLAPAESGLGAGGNITVISKSGSNRLAGSVFEFFRNDALDSASKYDGQKQDLEYNQFGGRSAARSPPTRRSSSPATKGSSRRPASVHGGGAERRSDPAHPGRRAGRKRGRAERGAHAGRGAVAGRVPARDGGHEPAARPGDPSTQADQREHTVSSASITGSPTANPSTAACCTATAKWTRRIGRSRPDACSRRSSRSTSFSTTR